MIKNMTATRSTGASLIAVLSVLALSACFTGTPVATPTVSPSPTTTPEPAATQVAPAPVLVSSAANVVISATGVTIFDDQVLTLASIPYTMNAATAADLITTALVEDPVVTTVEGSGCVRPGSQYTWGGLILLSAGDITMAPGAIFTVSATGETTSGGVALETTNGWHVGVPVANVIAALPGAPMDDGGSGFVRIELEHASGTGGDTAGVLAVGQDGTITSIHSPVYIFGDC
jgi:hypothetical protein